VSSDFQFGTEVAMSNASRQSKGETTMSESATMISIEHLPGNHSFHVHKDDGSLFTFSSMKTNEQLVEHRFEISAATLCFIRGTGKIAINGSLVEYGGKWFEIPRMIEYQIFPETDTVVLTIQKPSRDSIDMDDARSGGVAYDSHLVS
jgi:hypothetical protein